MKNIRIDLPREWQSVEVHTFADLHLGDPNCKMDEIKKEIEAVKDTQNAVVILNGDICNTALKTSVSDSYSETLTPMEQIGAFCDIFEPIKDRIIAITSGNHEERTWRTDGIDITQVCARQLGLEDRYARNGALIFLRVGEIANKESNGSGKRRQVCYVIYANHGSGGGRKEGAKAIRLADMASVVDADVYLHSHTHLPMIMKQAYYRTDPRNCSHAKVDKLFVNTSAKLEYGGYGEAMEFKPSSTDTPVIYLSGVCKRMEAKL